MLPSGRITLFANRVHWGKTFLEQAASSSNRVIDEGFFGE